MRIINMLLLASIALFQLTCSLPEIEDITPPVVLLVYPFSGSVITDTVRITIESTDDKAVTRTWYYLDGVIKGNSSSANPQFELEITQYIDNQSHVLQAGASDAAGNVGLSEQVQVTFADRQDIIPPTVVITAPQSGTTNLDTVKVIASAIDDRKVEEVAFFVDGDSVSTDKTYPYEYFWQIFKLSPNFPHSIQAKAYDTSRNWNLSDLVSITYQPPETDTQPPVVNILFPQTGTTNTSPIKVVATATDDYGIVEVVFFVNGDSVMSVNKYPYEYQWPIADFPPSVAHSLQVKATDTSNNFSFSNLVTVTYQPPLPDTQPPVVTIIYPQADTTSISPIKVVATATDDDKVAEVAFFVNGDSVFADSEYPYEYQWPIANWPGGIGQTLQAKAYDVSRNWSFSERIIVTYFIPKDTEPPVITLLYPPNEQILTGTVVVSTNITDNVGVTRVEFYVDGGINGVPNQVVTSPPGILPGILPPGQMVKYIHYSLRRLMQPGILVQTDHYHIRLIK